MNEPRLNNIEPLRKTESFEKRRTKGGRKKGRGIKWEKASNTSEILGFGQQETSPFDQDSGYNINELDLMHFTETPCNKENGRNSKFSIAQHVQANHRFVLKPNKDQDYFFATYDPDYKVEWDEIFMVIAKRNTDYLCPICREESMVVPMISQCGHIFCYPCILHYFLHASENEGEEFRKCPLCEEIVFKKTLKFAKVCIKPPPEENQMRTFKLVFRGKESNVVKYFENIDTKIPQTSKFENLEVPYHDSDAYNITRIRVCQDFGNIFNEYKHQLIESCKDWENLGDTLEVDLCQQGLEMIETLQVKLDQELEEIAQKKAFEETKLDEINQSEDSDLGKNFDIQNSNFSQNEDKYQCLADTQKRDKFEKAVRESKGNYYFYQMEDETNTFLDPLCMRILTKEYGSYENLPLKITSKILEIEEYNMTEALRVKYKPISHLGISAEFKFIELELSKLVTSKTYEHFEPQIRLKEDYRKRKIEQERKYMEKAKLIAQKKHEYYLKNNITVNLNTKSKQIPVWDTNKALNEDTWFTLDGKEIKADQESSLPWQEKEEKKRQASPPLEETGKENSETNIWKDFMIASENSCDKHFPALNQKQSKGQDKVPIIVAKPYTKTTSKRKKKKGRPKPKLDEDGFFVKPE
ncbi:unnamed protein product [Moneuplotes crassus]|uniref:RING-type domain-containing protein n=1 Tax=Euplotes crassus TaxID=5936 RepID=A0AAD1X0X2_EUPCR|nr:unnamed protein product [Moneuplotes crassus]